MRSATQEHTVELPTERISVYSGRLRSFRQKCIHPRRYVYTVTDLVLQTPHGPRALLLSLGCGCQLYEYLNAVGRLARAGDLYFEFDTQADRQHAIRFRAYDPEGWIGDNTARGWPG